MTTKELFDIYMTELEAFYAEEITSLSDFGGAPPFSDYDILCSKYNLKRYNLTFGEYKKLFRFLRTLQNRVDKLRAKYNYTVDYGLKQYRAIGNDLLQNIKE